MELQSDDPFMLPMSFSQQRLWFLEQYEPGTQAFNIPMAVRLKGKLDVAALEMSINAIIARHESLRTTFGMIDDEPLQIISDSLSIDLSAESADGLTDNEIGLILKEAAEQPFDLSSGPLLRVRLLRLSDHEHLLILCLHHIICDGWSIGVFLSELSHHYEAFSAGRQPVLPELEIQYADFSDWQYKMLESDTARQELAYWKQQLKGLPALLEVPTDRPRPVVQTFRGSSISFELGPRLTEKLQELAVSNNCTLLMVLLSAFMVLLGRLARQEDVIVGTPIANRVRSEIEPLIGFFVNTIALRGDLTGNPDFLSLLGRVRNTALDAYANQNTPFEKLVEALDPHRNLALSPIFQVLFAFQNMPEAELSLAGLTASAVNIERTQSQYDMTLTMTQSSGQLEGSLEYNVDLWDRDTVEQMIRCFKVILEKATDDPSGRIMSFPLLGRDMLEATVLAGNEEELSDSVLPFPAMFALQAERTPFAVAATFGREQMTYDELNRKSEELQPLLIQSGAGPDVMVGVCLERSLDLLVTLLAVMKSGAAYVPLDPEYPADRLAYIIKDSAMPVLLSSAILIDRLPECDAEILCVDQQPGCEHNVAPPCKPDIKPGHLAYTIYTSGSTGRPKGVQISHRSLTNFLISMMERPGMREGEGMLALTTVCFDIAALELFLPLSTGGCVHMVSKDIASDGAALGRAIEETGASVIQATPATWRLLVAAGWRGGRSIRLLCGGESLPASLARELMQGDVRLWNMYGPTETTIWSAAIEVTAEMLDHMERDLPVYIGGPVKNTKLYILDEHMNIVPPGVPGELYIGGAGLARGYLGRPDLTANNFVPDPYGREPGARLYKTGDLMRLKDKGVLEFLGRTDHQVKIRGFRIELGEIESLLCGHPRIEMAAVKVCGIDDNKFLAAYIVSSSALSESVCREFLAQYVPGYMIPAVFVTIHELPLTPNGKLDRGGLPDPSEFGSQDTPEYVAPQTAIEKRMAGIWESVLGARVGLRDDFFLKGGHSLLAMRLIARINRELHCNLPVQALFRNPTVESLVTVIAGSGSTDDNHIRIVRLGRNSSRDAVFCVPGAGGSTSYLRALASCVDRPFFGFEAAGLDGITKPHDSIYDIASEYIEAIRTVQSAGPYILMGHSFGSRVAYEIARLFHEQGERVSEIIVLDAVAPVFDADPVEGRKSSADCILELAEIFKYLTGRRVNLSNAELAGRSFDDQIKALQEGLGSLGEDMEATRLAGMVNVYQANHRIFFKAATVLPCAIKLIKASETIPSPVPVSQALRKVLNDPAWGWSGLSESPVTIAAVPGNHLTMMTEPHVNKLGELFEVILDDALRHRLRHAALPNQQNR